MKAQKIIKVNNIYEVKFYSPESDLIKIKALDTEESQMFYGHELEEILKEQQLFKRESSDNK